MKLSFSDEFTIEYQDKVLVGVFTQLTRKETKAFNKKHNKKDDTQEPDAVYKERLEISLSGEDKGEIMALGELYEYKTIFDTIIKDIGEKQAKN